MRGAPRREKSALDTSAAKPDQPFCAHERITNASTCSIDRRGQHFRKNCIPALRRHPRNRGTERRPYVGDFSNPSLKNWKDISSTYALLPHLALPNTPAKNATDIALVIDAMDMLHSGRFDAFCLVSSDSDLTRLASRIREQGLDVYGFGKAQTPASFRNACKRFYDTGSLGEKPTPRMNGSAKSPAPKQSPSAAALLIRKVADELLNDDGWAHLGGVGSQLSKLFPGFQSKTYGCSSLKDLVAKTGAFEIKGHAGAVYIRAKSGSRSEAG